MAVQGHDAMCRQALVGGNYALLNLTIPSDGGAAQPAEEGMGKGEGSSAATLSMTPNPDMCVQRQAELSHTASPRSSTSVPFLNSHFPL